MKLLWSVIGGCPALLLSDFPSHQDLNPRMQVLKGSAGGHALLAPDEAESQLVTRLGQELLVAARKHLQQESEETQDESEQERLASKLRALARPHWRFVVIDDDSVRSDLSDPPTPGMGNPMAFASVGGHHIDESGW